MVGRFRFGAVYIIEEGLPFAQIDRDIEQQKQMGFDLLTLWPAANSWLVNSPTEFAFEDTLRVMDLCQARGIQVIVQLIGQNQTQEYMPDALMTPDMYIQPESNLSFNSFWANPNHPKVEQCVRKFLSESVQAIKHHPALFAWDVFNEAHLRTDDPWTIELYREWLEARYGTIGNLNRRWYHRYASFDQILPADRNVAYNRWSSVLPGVEYERFRSENLTAICRKWVGYVKEYDSTHPVIIDGACGWQLSRDITSRNHDEFDTAVVCDLFGGSFYPKSWGMNLVDRPWELSLYFRMPADAAACAGKPYFINELQTHTQGALTPGTEVAPHELASWIWCGIASGAKGFQLWRWRPFLHGYQATGRGLTYFDGTPGPRASVVKDLVAGLRHHEALIAGTNPMKPAVKLIYSYRSRLFQDAWRRWRDSLFPSALSGWYRVFWSTGIPTQTVDLAHLSEEDLQTPALVLPSLVSLSQADAQVLSGYVRRGGTLIADARLAISDEWGVVPTEGLPGHILSELFGIRELDVAGPIDIAFQGEQIHGAFLSQHLEVAADAQVLAYSTQGNPAVVAHRFGRGHTLYFAACMGESFQQHLLPAISRFFRELIIAADPATPWAEKSDAVQVAFGQANGKRIAFVTNQSDESQDVRLKNAPGVESAIDLLSGAVVTGNELLVPAHSTQLLAWDSR